MSRYPDDETCRFDSQFAKWPGEIGDAERNRLKAQIATLKAELDAARRDAERYDWLRRFDHFAIVDSMLDTTDYNTLDAAVDAVRAAEAKS